MKIEKVLMMMAYFGTREWDFKNENIRRLIGTTEKFEYQRGSHNFDMKTIDWNEYFRNYIPGIKRYFFKEDCNDVKRLKSSYEW